jgi:catechol 2,3-dioxygenase-like lactoylglutathione lyase family enzyme
VLGVEDVDRSIAFYRDVVGFPLVATDPVQSYAQFDARGGLGSRSTVGHAEPA